MNAHANLILWEVLCLALFWSVFCRAVHANHTTKTDVRLALVGVGTAAIYGCLAPFLHKWLPDTPTLAIVASVVGMQVVFARHWRDGVPNQFVKEAHRPRRRVGDPQP